MLSILGLLYNNSSTSLQILKDLQPAQFLMLPFSSKHLTDNFALIKAVFLACAILIVISSVMVIIMTPLGK